MQSSENGLLRKMRSQHLTDDMIVRLFSDLIIAAGDTVSNLYFYSENKKILNFSDGEYSTMVASLSCKR